jgi:hypothetical protein
VDLAVRQAIDRQQTDPGRGEESQRIQILPAVFGAAQHTPVQADHDRTAWVAGRNGADLLTFGYSSTGNGGW